MARLLGSSQAWRSVYDAVSADYPGADTPDRLREALAREEADRPLWPARAQESVRRRLEDLSGRIDQMGPEADAAYRGRQRELAPQVSLLERRIAELGRAFLPVRWYYRLFRVPPMRRQLDELLAAPERAADDVRRARDALVDERRGIESDPHAAGASMVRAWQARCDRLRAAAESPEFAGAVAELLVIEELERLPDSYTVLSGLDLDLGRYIRLDGNYLRTAQVDHAVVGPSGVFVVETKNWSRNFARSGGYHDPFDQVKRARFLCQLLVQDRVAGGGGAKVRSVIAATGAMPPRPEGSYAKVLGPRDLRGYVQWFGSVLTAQQAEDVVSALLPYVGGAG